MAEEYKTFRSEQKERKMETCPHCKKSLIVKKKKEKKEMYPSQFNTFQDFMDDCLRRSRIRMEEEMGFGKPSE
tara:strand:- start:30257 stop:30475 length:219 start_codon:yes stop_codon:yes gene_type:complete